MEARRNILLPIDINDVSAIATKVAFAHARAHRIKVDVIFVAAPPGGDSWEGMVETTKYRGAYEQRLHELLASEEREGLLGELRVVDGDPSKLIVDASRELHSAMVVVGTHGRHGMSRLWMGSVAESVVRNAGCDVLVAKDPTADYEASTRS